MRQMQWIFLGALLLLALPDAFAAGPAPECARFPGEPPLQVCTQIKEIMKVGRSTKYRIWVEGTREPVEIRVHNSSPDVIRLKGGDDQVVRTSGGRRNDVEIKVKSLRVGSASLGAHPYSKDVREEAARIAAEIAPKLAAWQARFSRERAALPRPHPPAAVAALLDRTEAGLMAVLSYPELAAMRDHVRYAIREARGELHGFREPPAIGRVMLAAYASDDSALDRVAQLIARLLDLSRRNDYVVNLCVKSLPETGARFDMEPESYAEGGSETVTTGRLVNIYRGRYVYRATLRRAKPIECRSPKDRPCRPLDLVDDSRPLLVCDFDAGLCRRSDEAVPEGCRGNG